MGCNDDICDEDNCWGHVDVDDDDADDDHAGDNDSDGVPGTTCTFRHAGMCFKIKFVCLSNYSFSKEKYNGIDN